MHVDWFSSPERIQREAANYAVAALLPAGAVPTVLFEDHAPNVLAMTAVPQPMAIGKISY
ncbi:MAG: hypothetical protein R2867_24340 [Caldilineaceae bacterium]